ncbi:LolA family protein [Parapedobacter soli]|uniref:LolA family protein n=1 Tax=Parapedobacter soli TaxID=416955 RepID=UPI0021C6E247|nr:outer membrane lipoprotein carrier protein LolA [Parapedobacter soli]
MHTYKTSILALALLLCCAAGFAQRKALSAEQSAALKAKIIATTQNLQSLQSDFTQTKQLSYLENSVQSTGKFYFKAPEKIRWEYTSPASYVVIFDGQTMYTIADGRTKTTTLTANRRMKGLDGLLAGSLQGGDMLDESLFNISYYGDKVDFVAVLTPRDKGLSKYIQQAELVFNGTNLLLSQVTLKDPSGDTTLLTFTNQQQDLSIPDTTFQP